MKGTVWAMVVACTVGVLASSRVNAELTPARGLVDPRVRIRGSRA